MELKCLWCQKDLSEKGGKSKYCNLEHNRLYYNQKRRLIKEESRPKGRICELCGINIDNKNKGARYCCKSHKERHYRDTHKEQYKLYSRLNQKKNIKKIVERNKEKRYKEKEVYGFSKKYLRQYARRHIDDLRAIKPEKCYICSSSQYLGIHHTEYTKNPKDWEFICHPCHMKLHNPRTVL